MSDALPKSAFRLLLLEDNPSHIELIQETLNEYAGGEFILDGCDSPSDVIRRVGEGSYDGLLLDYNIHGNPSIDVLKKIREKNELFPVVVVSSTSDEATIEEAMKLGATGFITKNVTSLKTLPIYLKRVIQKGRQAARARQV